MLSSIDFLLFYFCFVVVLVGATQNEMMAVLYLFGWLFTGTLNHSFTSCTLPKHIHIHAHNVIIIIIFHHNIVFT